MRMYKQKHKQWPRIFYKVYLNSNGNPQMEIPNRADVISGSSQFTKIESTYPISKRASLILFSLDQGSRLLNKHKVRDAWVETDDKSGTCDNWRFEYWHKVWELYAGRLKGSRIEPSAQVLCKAHYSAQTGTLFWNFFRIASTAFHYLWIVHQAIYPRKMQVCLLF